MTHAVPTLAIATAPLRNSLHWQQSEISWAEIIGWLNNPAAKKEAGNYLLGELRPTTVQHPRKSDPCTNLHRRKDAIVSRSAITLDVDTPEASFADLLELTWPYTSIMHTTYNSAPGEERYRLIVPVDRPLLPDEYIAAATLLMRQLGVEQFDPGSTEPERYMFRPAAQNPEWFRSWVLTGEVATADALLAEFEFDLRDKPFPAPGRTKRDPFTLDGVIGAFNRAYADWDLLIKEFNLPYERAGAERWHLIGARSVAGMGEIAPGLVYSHHAGDPAFNRACSAFDLVRLHHYGELDEKVSSQTPVNRLPSHQAMLELIQDNERVSAELVGLDFVKLMDDTVITPNAWLTGMKRNKNGNYIDCIENWDLIKQHDPLFATFRFNALAYSNELDPLPHWRHARDTLPTMSAADRAQIYHYVEREYGIKAARSLLDEHIDTTARRRVVNPVRDYLEGLVWDRVPRVETSLPGVRPTAYTRLVARKVLVAAVARMLDPGCKWDHTLVLYGNEGLGKSYWVARLSRGYSASLGRIGDKDTLLTMHRSWIMISDEGHSLRKADAEVQKEFLTRTEDVFRLPYERETLAHQRPCVIWSTTNDEVFLRRQEGNRRFLIVRCEDKVDFEQLTDAYVDQLWAEAVYLYRAGERLFLTQDEAELAAEERESFIEEDALAGLIESYLETPKPDDWNEMSVEARQTWLRNRADDVVDEGTERQDEVCSLQIWAEAMGRRIGEHRRTDLLEISEAIKRLPNWESSSRIERIPNYGPQTVFRRKTS